MNIYRCMKCDNSAIESFWDESTKNLYISKNAQADITKIAHVHIEERDGVLFICPYCSEESTLSNMPRVPKVALKREFLEEDLFTL